jgi:cyclopropane fatty-acyl-phospholipid synthase-like methyltransferase
MVWFGSIRRMFDEFYRHTKPPWDIGRPRKQFVELARQGVISGSVLDIGCGTGENALFYAELGLEVWGIDFSPVAIRKAEEKAAKRGLRAKFLIQNALLLEDLNRKFDTATDSGFFHTLDNRERPAFARSLAAVLRPGGVYYMLCFSELEPPGYGPRRVSQQEIRECFRDGWTVNSIQPAVFESNIRETGARGWLSSISKKG